MTDEYVRGPGLPKRRRAIASHGPAPCPHPGCHCTHTPPCIAGWIDKETTDEDGRLKSIATPCPQCRPEAYRIVTDPALSGLQKGYRLSTRKAP